MEVAIPSPGRDFDFNSARSSLCVTVPSTPKTFGDYYFSAPTSPSHISHFYRNFNAFFEGEETGRAAVPFDWEEKPGIPKSPGKKGGDEFEFDVASEDWETASVAADELFDGGVIKPLKPPPRMQVPLTVTDGFGGRGSSPRPISQTKRMIRGAFSPRHRSKKEIGDDSSAIDGESEAAPVERGRERGGNVPKSSSRRAARSLSPLRDTRCLWEEEEKEPLNVAQPPAKFGLKKWRLMDFFLFRSASEGRAADKDPLKKYTAALRHSSFRSVDGSGSGSGSGSRRKGRVSAHELHYTVNRAASKDLKKKTFLPYKQGILGRLAFNPAVHALANGFGFSRK